jgi:uncharacterized membrane protein YkgB
MNMESVVQWARKIAQPLLRFSLGLVFLWIGALKFADPSPVVGLLDASLPFLASNGFVYFLGLLEVGAAVLLFFGIAISWVSLGVVGLFAGTLLIFLIAPAVSYGEAGFPFLTLAGEFLLKDLVLLAAAVGLLSITSGTPAPETTVPR